MKNHKPKIFVVDDEKMIRWSLGEALRGWGFEPIEAEPVSAALAASTFTLHLPINLPK